MNTRMIRRRQIDKSLGKMIDRLPTACFIPRFLPAWSSLKSPTKSRRSISSKFTMPISSREKPPPLLLLPLLPLGRSSLLRCHPICDRLRRHRIPSIPRTARNNTVARRVMSVTGERAIERNMSRRLRRTCPRRQQRFPIVVSETK